MADIIQGTALTKVNVTNWNIFVDQINTNAHIISQHAVTIAANIASIGGNASNIGVNSALIAANIASIAGNASNIGVNSALIVANIASIAGNASNIAVNVAAIDLNTRGINTPTTFTPQDTSPNVSTGRNYRTSNTSTTLISTFNNGADGKTIEIVAHDAKTRYVPSATLKCNASAVLFVGTFDAVRFRLSGSVWVCVGHEQNTP